MSAEIHRTRKISLSEEKIRKLQDPENVNLVSDWYSDTRMGMTRKEGKGKAMQGPLLSL